MKRYSVRARSRRYGGFRRSGRWFSSAAATILTEAEMTPEIFAEAMLIVSELPEEPEVEPVEPTVEPEAEPKVEEVVIPETVQVYEYPNDPTPVVEVEPALEVMPEVEEKPKKRQGRVSKEE